LTGKTKVLIYTVNLTLRDPARDKDSLWIQALLTRDMELMKTYWHTKLAKSFKLKFRNR